MRNLKKVFFVGAILIAVLFVSIIVYITKGHDMFRQMLLVDVAIFGWTGVGCLAICILRKGYLY